ncbi:MAG: T9SS type A sorting domain-containing protein [Flavobacteriales bacterium]
MAAPHWHTSIRILDAGAGPADFDAWSPAVGSLAVRLDNADLQYVRILDLAGRTVLEMGLTGSSATVQHALSTGIYHVVVTTPEGQGVKKVFLR